MDNDVHYVEIGEAEEPEVDEEELTPTLDDSAEQLLDGIDDVAEDGLGLQSRARALPQAPQSLP